MMRIAEIIAKENKDMALATGESTGQAMSRTVPPLLSTNEACMLPVLRLLIDFDKQGITERAEKMGSCETSIPPFEDCCMIFATKYPITNSELSCIKKSEEKLAGRIEELVGAVLHAEEIVLCEA